MASTRPVRTAIAVVVLIGFLGATTACYGPFNLTKTIHKWNGQIKGSGQVTDKWMRELVFLGLVILPVYQFAALGDAIVFNSIEFWTGDNPIKASDNEGRTRVAHVGDTTIAVAFARDGNSASVSYSREGQVVKTGTIIASDEGYQLMDENGHQLYAAEPALHGGVNLIDKNRQLVQHLSEDQLVLGAEKLAAVQVAAR